MGYEQEGVWQYEFDEFIELTERDDQNLVVIDVREIEEYVEGHIPGVPLIPMGEIVYMIDKFKRDQHYIFICRSGRRSHEVAKFFKANGFEHVSNYAGGMLAWRGALASGEEKVVKDVSELYN